MDYIPTLFVKDFISNPNRSYASIISDSVQLKTAHLHDYYELFIVSSGSADHIVNRFIQPLSTGYIAFIRPNDVHSFEKISSSFQIVNIIIPPDILNDIFLFLGPGFDPQRLLSPSIPPIVQISYQEYSLLLQELEQLVLYNKLAKDKSDLKFKISLLNIITTYFPLTPSSNQSSIPEWIHIVWIEMLKKENYIEGLPAMKRISQKSSEHLSRSFRKYIGKSPTEFINEIRIENAARLIVLTDDSIINICNDIGFNSLSSFYRLFKSSCGMSPQEYRKNSRKENSVNNYLSESLVSLHLEKGVSPFKN